MRLLACRLRLLLGLSVSVVPLGCSTSAATSGPHLDPLTPPDTAVLAFDDPGTLALPWGVSDPLYVTATPAMEYRVGFSLVGDSFDASLDSAVVFTGSDGRGLVTLRAPTHGDTLSTTFQVRASLLDQNGVPGASAERTVAVSSMGSGSIQVSPVYLGKRPITTWTAGVMAATTCADLKAGGMLPGAIEGTLTGTATAGGQPIVEDAPVGGNLAVAVRAGHFAWGCTDTTMLTKDATLQVVVNVIDKPIDLPDASLAATFAFTPDPTAYGAVLGDAVNVLIDAFMPLSSTEGTILLNGMAAAATPADAAAFASYRVADQWDALADTHLAGKSLRDTCSLWATKGAAAQPTSFLADLAGGPGASLTVTMVQFGTLDPTVAGVTVAPGAVWNGLPDDSVQVNSTLLWQPSRFVGVSSLAPALAAQPTATTVAAALSLEADCHGLATAMGAFGNCGVACVENLCDAAIATRWTTALDASKKMGSLGQISIQGAGNTTVGDLAQPVTLTGYWQGMFSDTENQASIKGGALTATVGPPTP